MTDMKDSIINSITGDINKLFEDKNNTFTKKEFADAILIAARYAYDTYYSNKKTKKKWEKLKKSERPENLLNFGGQNLQKAWLLLIKKQECLIFLMLTWID